jgi:hypothetical protein
MSACSGYIKTSPLLAILTVRCDRGFFGVEQYFYEDTPHCGGLRLSDLNLMDKLCMHPRSEGRRRIGSEELHSCLSTRTDRIRERNISVMNGCFT